MARTISKAVRQQFLATWEALLRQWGDGDREADPGRLGESVGAVKPLPLAKRRKFGRAAASLRTALDADQMDEGVALAVWIEAYLLTPGPFSLWDDDARYRGLEEVRQQLRRSARTAAGMRSSRVEMPESAWQRLDHIQLKLEVRNRSLALERIIMDHGLGGEKISRRKSNAPNVLPPATEPTGKQASLPFLQDEPPTAAGP
jgi:hypothetical protein